MIMVRVVVLVLAIFTLASSAFAQAPQDGIVALLVPGIDTAGQSKRTLGSNWCRLIESLRQQGYRFGGVIRPNPVHIRLPDSLDRQPPGIQVDDPRSANLFYIEPSSAANGDLTLRALEFAECVREIVRFTGCSHIRPIPFSAGGLVVRLAIERAVPGIDDLPWIDRVIFIATPHLGVGWARNIPAIRGTPLTSLSPDSELIVRLNALELPESCDYASLVIRGIRDGATGGAGREYDRFTKKLSGFADLPPSYLQGGDEVVSVISSNLRFSPAAITFEQATGRAVQSLVVRVAPSNDNWFSTDTIHSQALQDATVQQWVAALLACDRHFWSCPQGDSLEQLVALQARQAAFDVIEAQALNANSFREVTKVDVQEFECTSHNGRNRTYRFRGQAQSRDYQPRETLVEGTLELKFDRFGRVTSSRQHIAKMSEP